MAEHLAELMELTDRDEVEAAKADVVAQTTAGPSTA
jgi:hypothetical protein